MAKLIRALSGRSSKRGDSATGFGGGFEGGGGNYGGTFGGVDEKFHVTVPSNMRPGESLRVELPNGKAVTLVIPEDAKPGSTLEVEREEEVEVNIPKEARVGDPLQVEVAGGATLAFTVPPGSKPGSKIKLSVPVSQLRRSVSGGVDEALDVDVTEISAVIPQSWDGYSPISTDVDGRPLLFQAPAGARCGDEVLLDVPTKGAKVRLKFEVPYGARGGEVIAVTTPSGHLKFVTLPDDASSQRELTVRIVDEPDAETSSAASPGFQPMRAALQARVRDLGPASNGGGLVAPASGKKKKKAQPIFTTIAVVGPVS